VTSYGQDGQGLDPSGGMDFSLFLRLQGRFEAQSSFPRAETAGA